MEKRVYYIHGAFNSTLKNYETLEEAIVACDKYNKKVKHKRTVYSGIHLGDHKYLDPKLEYVPEELRWAYSEWQNK